jgi:hypothetical protein
MTMLDINLEVKQAIAPQVAGSDGAVNGTSISLSDNLSAVIVFSVGTLTDGSFTPSVEESDDGGSTWTAVAAADLRGTLVAVTTSNDPKIQQVVYQGELGMIRPVITAATTTDGGPIAAYVILGDEKQAGGSVFIT